MRAAARAALGGGARGREAHRDPHLLDDVGAAAEARHGLVAVLRNLGRRGQKARARGISSPLPPKERRLGSAARGEGSLGAATAPGGHGRVGSDGSVRAAPTAAAPSPRLQPRGRTPRWRCSRSQRCGRYLWIREIGTVPAAWRSGEGSQISRRERERAPPSSPVPARPDDVEDAVARVHGDRVVAHGLGEACDLRGGLALEQGGGRGRSEA